MLNAIIDYTGFTKKGELLDGSGNYHYFYIGAVDYKKNKFLIYIDHAGDYKHLHSVCLLKVYKTKRPEIISLDIPMVSDSLLRNICAAAIELYS